MSAEPIDEKAVFNIARRIDAREARADYLQQVCGANPEALRRVLELLQLHEQEHSFLESPAVGMNVTIDQPTEKPGTQIGPYKLLQQIGEGGMGVVYMAEQTEPVKRRVALKIIKPGMDTRQVIARFEAERQALSLMDHPNIARVLDAGTTESGRPYFVMELVKGQPITQYCDEHHLTPRQRLELLLPVCQAIQHAHQKGIIHRDIKPTNILVAEYDQKAVPKVIDFGVAKATSQALTEKTMFTGLGQIVGTLEYMSPEQAKVNQLDIDTRSDIYTLGVLLYELLTGSTPFDKERLRSAGWDEMLRIIREEEPEKPSTRLSDSSRHAPRAVVSDGTRSVPTTLASIAVVRSIEPTRLTKLVRGELDWIVMKALEKDRSRRYETATGLASDIQRYLNDEPVMACPPSAAYRFRKFARRNKTLLGTTSTVAAALVLGLIGTTWQSIRAKRAEQQAIIERDDKEAARRVAAASAEREAEQRRLAEGAAVAERVAKEAETQQRKLAEAAEQKAAEEAAVAKAVNEFLQKDLLGLAGGDAQLDAGIEPDPDLKLTTLLDRANANVEERFADQPRVRIQVQLLLASGFARIGRYQAVVQIRERVLAHCEQLLGREHHATLISIRNLSIAYKVAGQREKALALGEESLEGLRKILNAEHSDVLMGMGHMAALYAECNQFEKAVSLGEQTVDLSRKVWGPQHHSTLIQMKILAVALDKAGRHDRAIALGEQVVALARTVLGPKYALTRGMMGDLSVFYGNAGQYNKALALGEQLLELQRTMLGPENPHTLQAMNNVALANEHVGKYDKAIAIYEEALARQRKVRGPEHPTTLLTMGNLAIAYGKAGQSDKAGALYAQTLELCRKVLGPEHLQTTQVMGNFAVHLMQVGQLEMAIPLQKETLEIRRKVLGPEHPYTLTAMSDLAATYQHAKQYELAIKVGLHSLELRRKVLGPEHPNTRRTLKILTLSYQSAREFDQAIPLLNDEIARTKAQPTMTSVDEKELSSCLALRALCLLRVKRWTDAEASARESLALRERSFAEDWNRFSGMSLLGECLHGQEKYPDAEPLLVQGYEGMKTREDKIPAQVKFRLTEGLERLVNLYEAWGKPEEASRWKKELEATQATNPKNP